MNDVKQLINLFLTCPETGADCFICSPLIEEEGGFSSFYVRSKKGTAWKHSFKTEEYDSQELEKLIKITESISKNPPIVEIAGPSFISLDGETINTHYKFEEDGTETPVKFEARTV